MNKKFLSLFIMLNIAIVTEVQALDNRWVIAGVAGVSILALAGAGGSYYQLVAKPECIEKEKQFLKAVKGNNIDLCRDYLKEGGNVNATDERGYTALHYAARKGHVDLMNLFFEQRLHLSRVQQYIGWLHPLVINIKSDDGSRPLHEAARSTQRGAIEALVQNKADIEATNNVGDTPLMCAVQEGHVVTVKQLIDLGAHKSACNKAGESALYIASRDGCVPLISLLMSCCEEEIINMRAKNGFTPLLIAAEHAHKDAVSTLLDAGADPLIQLPNGKNIGHIVATKKNDALAQSLITRGISLDVGDKKGRRPLMYAALCNDVATATTLLSFNPEINASDNNGLTALSLAAEQGHREMVSLLLKQSNIIVDASDKKKETPLIKASAHGDDSVVSLLLNHGADRKKQDEQGNAALHKAAEKGHLSIARSLVDSQHIDLVAQENNEGNLPIHKAAQCGKEQLLNFLLEYNSPINKQNNRGFSPLHYAAQQGSETALRKLLEQRASRSLLTKNNNSALHVALLNRHASIAELLVDDTVINVKNSDDDTPLILASCFGYRELAEVLLNNYKVHVNKKGKSGRTALFFAAQKNNLSMVMLLLPHHANPNIADNEKNVALGFAAQHGNTIMIDFLWRYGAEVNLKGKGGRTPLAVAAAHGHKNAIDKLLRCDARFGIRDSQNNTPFLLAAQHGHTDVVDYFLRQQDFTINIEDSDWQGDTALIKSAARGHGEVVKILLRQGVNIYHINHFKQQAYDVARGPAKLIVRNYKNKYDGECASIEKLQNNIALLERQSGSGVRVFKYKRGELEEMHSPTRQQKIRELQKINDRLVQEAEKFKQKVENREQVERECRSILQLQQGIKTLDNNNQESDCKLRQHDKQYAAGNHYQVYDGSQFSEKDLGDKTSSQRKQMIQRLSKEQEERQQKRIRLEERLKKIKQVEQPARAQEESDDEEKCFICMDDKPGDILFQEVRCPSGSKHPAKIHQSCQAESKRKMPGRCPYCGAQEG